MRQRLFELECKVEVVRSRLNRIVVEKRFDLQDPAVIALSVDLDKLIVELQKGKQLAK